MNDLDLFTRDLAQATMFQVRKGRLEEANQLLTIEVLRELPDIVLDDSWRRLSQTLLRDTDTVQERRVALLYDPQHGVCHFGPEASVSSRSPLPKGTIVQVDGPPGLLDRVTLGSWLSDTLRVPHAPEGVFYLVEKPRPWRGGVFIAAVTGTETYARPVFTVDPF